MQGALPQQHEVAQLLTNRLVPKLNLEQARPPRPKRSARRKFRIIGGSFPSSEEDNDDLSTEGEQSGEWEKGSEEAEHTSCNGTYAFK